MIKARYRAKIEEGFRLIEATNSHSEKAVRSKVKENRISPKGVGEYSIIRLSGKEEESMRTPPKMRSYQEGLRGEEP